MNDAPAINLDRVSWTYAGSTVAALDGIDLSIGQGETVILAGASGSGKSTALRLMNGLIPHLHAGELTGDMRVLGTLSDTLDLAELGQRTGSVWQHPFRQFFTGAVTDEIAFAMENHAEPPDKIRRRIAELLLDYDLTALRSRRLSTLSSGEQQLVAILASIAHRPPILLLDEPTANLSDDAADRLVAALDRLRSEGTTIVIAEHRIHPFVQIADRIILFQQGRAATTWTPTEFTSLAENDLLLVGLRSRTVDESRAVNAVAQGRSIATENSGYSTPTAQELGPDVERDLTVSLEGVRCVRDGLTMLDIEHAVFPPGCVTAIRGPNGAGKTTLARIISGLQRHHGVVRLNGQPVSRAERRRNSMLITQEVQRQLFADTVKSELELATNGGSSSLRNAKLLTQLGIDHLEERHPLSLSGGQQQRLAIAVARLSSRQVIILDEPSTGVDAHHLATISSLITQLADQGRTVIVISHDDQLLSLTADVELTLAPLQ